MLKNPRHEKFARLVAGGKNATTAYKAAGFACASGAKQSANRLLANAEVSSRIEILREEINSRITGYLIAEKSQRVAAQQIRWNLLSQVRRERAADPDVRSAPGGTTGFVVRRQKMLGGGETAELVEEYEVDYGLLRAFNELENIVALELGQRIKTTRVIRSLDDLTTEELENLTK